MLRKISILLILTIIFVQSSFGQSTPEDLVSIKFSCVSLEKRIKDLKFFSQNKTDEINVFVGTRSRLVNYQGSKQLTFFRETVPNTPNAQAVRTPVGRVMIDGKSSRYLFFFTRRSGQQESYSIFAMPDNSDNFRAGTYRFLNLAPYNVALKLGETKTMLAKQNLTDVKGSFKHGSYYPTTMVSLPEKSPPIPSYEGRIYFNKNMRMLYIIRPNESGELGKFRLSGIIERMNQ